MESPTTSTPPSPLAASVARVLRSYRPFLAAAACVGILLVSLPPGRDDTTAGTVGATLDQGVSAGNGTGGGGGVDTAVGGTGGDGSAGSGGSSTAAPGGTPESEGAPGSVAGAGTAWPGIGTPNALSAPDCDPETGYLMIQTKAWNLPCVPLWPKGADNGGATAMGVEADSIKVVVYYAASNAAVDAALLAAGVNDTREQLRETMEGWKELFNRHAELYGRQIELVHVEGSGTDAEAHRADAINAYNKHKPFAVLSPTGGAEFEYQMALRGVVSVNATPSTISRYAEAAPYQWLSPAGASFTAEQTAVVVSEFICKQLSGKPARWAGDPLLAREQRKFGWLYLDGPDTAQANQIFRERLAACGESVVGFGINGADVAQGNEQVSTAIAKFRSEGVNVVISNASFLFAVTATKQATAQSYRPEWLGSGFSSDTATIFMRTYDPAQLPSWYGQKSQPLLPRDIADGDGWSLYRWEHGKNPSAQLFADKAQLPAWWGFMSGVMLAGPDLTATTFGEGMLRMPPIGGSYSNSVSSVARAFGNRGIWPWESSMLDTTTIDDNAWAWWDVSGEGPDESGKEGVGIMTFIDGGKRFTVGSLPNTEPAFFDQSNKVAFVDQLGPNDAPKQYENKGGCRSRQDCYG